jgi:hypothetical protein
VPRLPVVSVPGDSIELIFLSSNAANSILRTKGPQPADVDNRIVAFKICSIWHQQSNISSLFHDGVFSMQPVFYRCHSLKGGDAIVELQPETCFLDDKQSHYSYLLIYRFRRSVPGEPIKQLVFAPRESIVDGELNRALCAIFAVRVVRFSSTPTHFDVAKQYAPCSGYLHDGRRYVVYRVLLYCDAFQPYARKIGSFGGCYMLPMGRDSSVAKIWIWCCALYWSYYSTSFK